MLHKLLKRLSLLKYINTKFDVINQDYIYHHNMIETYSNKNDKPINMCGINLINDKHLLELLRTVGECDHLFL